MRPQELVLSAFGPFAQRTVIDFSRLGDRSLFLIHGPTGSGKSSVLDGICYALYGETSARERQESDLRSHHAGDDTPTEVRFTFTRGQERFRVVRAPEQIRPKKRGEGTTTAKKTAALYRYDAATGDFRLLADRPAEVDERVQALLGFEASQFRQVVILPQGKIRRLLSAGSDERREILATLFQTQEYRRIQEALRDEARSLDEAAAGLERDRAVLLENEGVADAAGLAALLADERAALAELDARIEALRAQEREQTRARDEGRATQALFDERDAAQAALRSLEADAPARTRRREALARAHRARAMQPTPRALAELRTEIAALQADLARLTGRRDEAAQADREARMALDAAEASRGEGEENLRALERLAGLQADAEALERARAESGQAAQALAAAEAAQADRAAARAARATALEERQAALQIEEARAQADGQAIRLAAGLTPGQPCPVCGSTEHPAPARESGADASPATAAEAESAGHKARALREEIARLREALQGMDDEDQALAPELTAARTRATAAETRVAALAERIPEKWRPAGALRAEQRAIEARSRQLAEDLERATATRARAAEALAGLEARLAEQGQQLDRRGAALADQEETLRAALVRAGFADERDFEDAHLDEGACAALERRCASEEADLAAARQRLARAEAAFDGRAPVDLPALEAALAEGRAALAEASEERGRQDGRIRRLDEKHRTLLQKAEAQAELEARYGLVGDLAEVACDRSTSFESYVLSAMLDEVLAVASQRLWVMSRQRYLLRRDESAGDRRRHSGLDLLVEDAHTGTERPVRSLSGGEGFLASLALALALAEVVQAQSGGIHLDTIFIDEGFGSLDPESLEQAFATLMQIEQTGRLVGVISHVGELAERIDARLLIQPSPSGSSARFVL